MPQPHTPAFAGPAPARCIPSPDRPAAARHLAAHDTPLQPVRGAA